MSCLSHSKGLFGMGLVSVSKARARLGVSAQSVRRFIGSGELLAEKSNTDRWMVDEKSLETLITSRKTQQPKAPIATPKATEVAKKDSSRGDKPTSQSNIATAKFNQTRDIVKFRDIITTVLSAQGVTWLTAQELTAIFHNSIFEFSNAEKFTVEVSTDWSEYLGSLYMTSTEIGELIRFDENSINHLINGRQELHQDEIPSEVYLGRVKNELSGRWDHSEVEAVCHRFITVSYGGVAVCRSAPHRIGITLLSSTSND